MRRTPTFLAAAVALLALALAGCSSGTGFGVPPAATVNGTDISRDEILDDLAALAGNEQITNNLAQQGVSIQGESEGTYSAEVSSQVLSAVIVDVLVAQELEARGEAPTPDELASAQESLTGLEGLPEGFAQRQVTSAANRAALSRVLASEDDDTTVTDEDVRAYYDENIDAVLERLQGDVACVSHILVETEEEAQAAAARLTAGESFAAVAAEVSTDPGSGAAGGDLGCQQGGTYVAEFEAAVQDQPIGVVGPPVQTEFGYHLILVRSRGELPFEEVADDIRAQLEQQAATGGRTGFDKWLERAVAEAEVTVDPFFGSWDPDAFPAVVQPPEGAERPAPEGVLPGDGELPVQGP